jgi:hypothetical protein
MLELKRLAPDAVEAAQEKAMRYRLLNKPRLAESICRDILAVDPDNAEAIVTLILALTDQYGMEGAGVSIAGATALVARLEGEYERQYYSGIACERMAFAKLSLATHASGHLAYDWFMRAMSHYDKAAAVRPAGNDDALLRWNTCARVIDSRSDVHEAHDEPAHTLLE